ncbi:MAG: hypothetical protein KME46_22015 [Brasilonema angustatum HA4187-MV1]|jgi:hypothetical protein|nr:hypothetical protein [Brasilonema angustatum HA4187-MV1]
MSINYFSQSKTVEDIKSLYRSLAMQHHPDRGGSEDVMKEINRQYHEALKACDGKTSHTSEGEEKTYRYRADIENELMDKLLELLKLRSLNIALIGYWIWVGGDTKPNREALKEAGLHWHSERKLWYYKPLGWKKARKSKGTLGELAQKYGYRGFQTAEKEQVPTVS